VVVIFIVILLFVVVIGGIALMNQSAALLAQSSALARYASGPDKARSCCRWSRSQWCSTSGVGSIQRNARPE
jgi:hypothetical protein